MLWSTVPTEPSFGSSQMNAGYHEAENNPFSLCLVQVTDPRVSMTNEFFFIPLSLRLLVTQQKNTKNVLVFLLHRCGN